MGPGRALPLIAVVIAVVLTPPPSWAAPTVLIRARTRIEIEEVWRTAVGVAVRGRAVDRVSGAPLPWAGLRIDLDERRRAVQSDGDGRFEVSFGTPVGTHELSVALIGDARYQGSVVTMREVDPALRAVTLTVSGRERSTRAEAPLEVTMSARSGAGPIAVTLAWSLSDDDDAVHAAGEVTTDGDGAATISLGEAQLGGPGRKRVDVRLPRGDPGFQSAHATLVILITVPLRVDMSVGTAAVDFDAAIITRGLVVDDRGEPVAGAPVSITASQRARQRVIGKTISGPDGRFELSIAGATIGAGRFTIAADIVPSVSWQLGARSEPLAISVAEAPPMPAAHTVALFAGTALMLASFWLTRSRPWHHLRHGKRGAAVRAATDAVTSALGAREENRAGLRGARPGLVSTLRRPGDHGFTGVIADGARDRPLAGARLLLAHAGAAPVEVTTDAAGAFAIEALASGEWRATAGCPGYVTEAFVITVPHRGELRGAAIDLVPVRERVFALYRGAAQPLLPEPDLWGIWTPRQIVDHVRQTEPAPALAALTEVVEEAYFSARTPDEHILEEIARQVSAARAESPRRARIVGAKPGPSALL